MRIHRYAVLSLATLALTGCMDRKCQPGDSAKTCEVLTQCFSRGEKAPACVSWKQISVNTSATSEKHCPRLHRGRFGPELRPEQGDSEATGQTSTATAAEEAVKEDKP